MHCFFYSLVIASFYLSCRASPLSGRCYPIQNLRQGRLPGAFLRRLPRTGPLTCVRECLLRRNCLSVNYNNQLLVCELNHAKLGSGGYTLSPEDGFKYIEKTEMKGMIDISPCTEKTCAAYERCDTLFNGSIICSTTECRPQGTMTGFQPHRGRWSNTLSVGQSVYFNCEKNMNVKVTHKCHLDGTWKSTDKSLQRCKCTGNKGFSYDNKTNGCYRFVNESKSHSEAKKYCRSVLPGGHLFLADSSEKIKAVINCVIPQSYVQFVWIDGVINKTVGDVVTWRGVEVNQLRRIPEYAEANFHQSQGCLKMFPMPTLREIRVESECRERNAFVCEIDLSL